MLVGPKKCAVDSVDKTIAIWAKDRHVPPSGSQQIRLKVMTLGVLGRCLGKSAGEAYGPPTGPPDVSQHANCLDRGVAVDANKGRIRRSGKGFQGGIDTFSTFWVDPPNLAVEAHLAALFHHLITPSPPHR